MDAGLAMLRITSSVGSFDFLLPEELPEVYSYTSETDVNRPWMYGNVQPDQIYWYGGKDDEVSLKLKLVAGISYEIDTPEDLKKRTEQLASMAQPRPPGRGGQASPEQISLEIGSWFFRRAAVLGCKVAFSRPYDPDTGLPYVAEVTFRLQYVYETLPDNQSFSFASGGR